MIICCSPTKTMKSEAIAEASQPMFAQTAAYIASLLKDKNKEELMKFYKCNEKIALQNVSRFQSFEPVTQNNAGLCFDGLQFKRMQVHEWNQEDWDVAQEHLRIMSGLYGMLRVKDGISEYRLDVENPLQVEGKSLTEFWRLKLADGLKDECILDCCSKEYSALLPETKCSVSFYVEKQGKLKIEATAAKMARGSLIYYCIKHKIDNIEAVKAFNEDGYHFHEQLSNAKHLVFVKEVQL